MYIIYQYDEEIFKDLEYRDIKHDMYEISNRGKIRNKRTMRILKTFADQGGYLKIRLRTDYGAHNYSVSRMVAYHFIPEDRDITELEVHHRDNKRHHNYHENLKYATTSENVQHSYTDGFHVGPSGPRPSARGPRPHTRIPHPYMKGELNVTCIHKSELIHEICGLLENGYDNKSIRELVDFEEGLSKTQIQSLLNSLRRRKIWRHITDLYKY
jgi:hypothetical protein